MIPAPVEWENIKTAVLKTKLPTFNNTNGDAWREMQEELLWFAEERFTVDSEAAFQAYLDIVSDNFLESVEEPAFVSFIDWFIYDYQLQAEGKNLIQCFLTEKQRELGPMEVKLLQDWADSHISLLRVLAVGQEWLSLEDLLAG